MHFACKNNQQIFRSKIISVFFALEHIYIFFNDKFSYLRTEFIKVLQ